MNTIVYVGMDVHKESYTLCCYSYDTDKRLVVVFAERIVVVYVEYIQIVTDILVGTFLPVEAVRVEFNMDSVRLLRNKWSFFCKIRDCFDRLLEPFAIAVEKRKFAFERSNYTTRQNLPYLKKFFVQRQVLNLRTGKVNQSLGF